MTRKDQILARLREVGVRVADVSVGRDDQPETWEVHLAHLHPSAFERKAVAIVLRDIAHPPKPRTAHVPPIDSVPKPTTLPVSTPPVDVPAPIKKRTHRRPVTRPPPPKATKRKKQ